MANGVTHFSTVISPEVHFDSDNGPWQRVLLTMCFSGRLPRQTVQGDIPIHISVSIAEEYGEFTSPVMETISVDFCSTRPSSPFLIDDSTPSQAHNDLLPFQEDVTIPFLPLRGIFNYTDSKEWAALSKEIEEWLVAEVDSRSQLWTWGRDAFWLTFVAAYPLFPRGKWPMWDPRVPVEGTFIKEWLGRPSDIDGSDQSVAILLGEIWAEFVRHTALFYPSPLLAAD
ncbi:hypothetical protein DEU56DRAFT_910081 [Suillus clintonianus]|uniref:uncharacterized protein n=1 Tax=Suillus clintonianus TaxID=1904413 RepID=UPI001B85B8E7|nr:uncharacterized protein DEU56DRAFT_910081 [Suillus clintonianus]KAG2145798.1 hypothetical protein DEU56DRAFT_910081 [Suillus clintonianus]